jgi:hypothetical protein
MSAFIDKKFINLMSASLEKFKWRRDNIATCRCFMCGDSKKCKTKTRGYFYVNKGQYFYKCHNCGFACTVKTVLDNVAPQLAREYALEAFKSGSTGFSNEIIAPAKEIVPSYIGVKVTSLPDTHYAKKYVMDRGIPTSKLDLLYFCDNFSLIAEKFFKTSVKEPRLVIPFFDENKKVIGIQGRSFDKNSKIRYITYKSPHIERLWYGIDRINTLNPVYVVEGPLDSLFLPNAIAMVGSSYPELMPPKLISSKLIFVFDNEPRNVQLHHMMEKAIDDGHSIVIWPNIHEKDINEMVVAYGYERTKEILDINTYSGNIARLKFLNWRKI